MNLLYQIENYRALFLFDQYEVLNLQKVYDQVKSARLDKSFLMYKNFNSNNYGYQAKTFWTDIITKSAIFFNHKTIEDPKIKRLENNILSSYKLLAMDNYFNLLSKRGERIFLFINHIDNIFETLDSDQAKPILNGIRNFSSIQGLRIVTTSKFDISTLNKRLVEYFPHGSPIFNIFQEINVQKYIQL